MEQEIYLGDREEKFKNLITEVLSLAKLKTKYLDVLTDNSALELYDKAFTHSTIDIENNYEFLEILGDATLNKAIIWYFARRFPQLNCGSGVKILARLKIKYVSKKQFADFADTLGFWPFISAAVEIRNTKKKPILEDCFEAFIGATETLIDTRIRIGTGYHICYDIIRSLFDTIDISLKYETLIDAKTRLKELFDTYRNQIGQLTYENIRDEVHRIQTVTAYSKYNGHKLELGKGSAALKHDAEQIAAENALKFLESKGYIKEIPEEFKRFCNF